MQIAADLGGTRPGPDAAANTGQTIPRPTTGTNTYYKLNTVSVWIRFLHANYSVRSWDFVVS